MKFLLISLLVFVLLVFFLAWDILWWSAGVRPLLPARLKKMLNSEEDAPVLLDVRTGFEYNRFHIRGAKHCPALLMDPDAVPTEEADKPVVVICMSGHRSAVAAYRMRKRGFTRTYYLAWGMLAWVLSGGPTAGGNGEAMKG